MLSAMRSRNITKDQKCLDISFAENTKSKQVQGKKRATIIKMNHNYVLYFGVLWCLIFTFHETFAYTAKINVSLGFVAPLDSSLGPLTILGKELESAFKLAVQDVNKQESNVRLRVEFIDNIKDEGKNPTESCKKAAQEFYGDSKIVGIVGGYSSECSIAIQNELKLKKSKLPQISYRSPSVKLLQKNLYPTFFRTSSNNKKEAQVIVDVIKNFRWNQAAIIHSDDEYYGKELSDEIVSRSKNSGIFIKERKSFSTNESRNKIEEKLQQIKASGSRINIIVAQGNDFFKIVKQIKAKRMYGEGWVWIATDGGASLYLGSDSDVNITTDGFVCIIPEMFSGRSFLSMVISWYEKNKVDYPGKIWRSESDPAVSPFVGQVFRAVSAYHAVLNKLYDEKKLTVKSTAAEIRTMVADKLKTLNGPSKNVPSVLGNPIYFDSNTEGQPKFVITNYITGATKSVGTWDESASPHLDLPAGKIIWPGGGSQTPTDKGRPGKALFRVGFVSPTSAPLGSLSKYGKELLSAFKVAVDLINKDENYQIEIDPLVKDEGVDGNKSCTDIANSLKDMNLAAVVGSYRSECTMALHDVLGDDKYRIPIVTYAAPSQQISDKSKYKYLFRVSPSNKNQSEIMKQIVRKFKFNQVATLYSDEPSSKEIAKDFEGYMKNDTIPIILSQEFPSNNLDSIKLEQYVEKIRQSGARVIFVSALPNDIVKLELIIREKKMAGKGWIWLGSDGATTNHFSLNSDIAKAMDGMIGVNPKRGEGAQYLKLLSSWLQKDKLMYPGIVHSAEVDRSLPYTAQVYDAVNGVALALTDLVSRQSITHKSDTMSIRGLLYEKLRSYDSPKNGFISALGTDFKMYFDENQDGPTMFDVVNLVDSQWRHIGDFKQDNMEINYIKDPLFPGGHTKPVVGAGKIIYKVAAFVPKHTELRALGDLGKVWESALKAAVRWVNRNESLTVGFDVEIHDTGMNANNCSEMAKRFIPGYIDIVIGAARSECTAGIYQVIKDRGIPMLSYSSTSSVLSMKANYPNLFRMCPSDEHQAKAIADLVEKYSWGKLGVVSAEGIYGQELSADVKQNLNMKHIKVTTTELFKQGAKRMTKQIANLKESGSGVNIMIGNPHDALQLYQEAFELGMVGKGWTWLGSDGAITTMFKRSQNLQRAMQGMVGFRPQGGSGKLFRSIYEEWLRFDNSADDKIAYIAQVFDSIILPAMTLHQLHKEGVVSSQISKIDVRGHLLRRLKSLQSAEKSFESTTGKDLYFNSQQDINGAYDLVNLNGNSWVSVGKYEEGQLDITSSVIWPGGTSKSPQSDQPFEQKGDPEQPKELGGTSQGLIVLAVVFSVFGLLVIVFMIYIVRRVRYRHLYMQSDLNQGGVFSVLYGHTVNRPAARSMSMLSTSTGHLKGNTIESGIEVTDPMMPRHV